MELLAPAGSFSALCAAVQSGADAVYIGGSSFSARRSAVNFSIDEIKAAVRYCHLRNVKLHVAANILVKEKEKDAFLEYIGELNDIGVDAVIIQDIGMAKVVRNVYPELPLHASTQMTVTNEKGAKFLAEMGFSRIVLARELSFKAIKNICNNVDVETEVFAHGAICMSYSGQCLMSSIIGGRSGNRGMCAQPCRLPYKIDEKTGYLLSPKDLCMADRVRELKEIGVSSIKIEGRLKRSEYVAAVSGVYRKYIDKPERVSQEDIKILTDAFSRSGFTSGYFDDKLGKNMMCYNNPANSSGNIFTDDVKRRCQDNANYKKLEIFMSAEMKEGRPLYLSVWDENGNFVAAKSNVVAEKAINKAIDKDRIEKQLAKMGDTPFFVETIEIDIDDGITIPVSEINSTRRHAIKLFLEKKCELSKRQRHEYVSAVCTKKQMSPPILTAQVSTYEQAKVCISYGISEIYADTPLANQLYDEFKDVKIIAKLSPVQRDDRKYSAPKTDCILISNIGQIDTSKKCFGDFRLNLFNSESISFYEYFERVTVSPELNLKELSGIAEGCEIIGYGRLPLMVMENCPLRAIGKCQKFSMKHSLDDRKNEKFPLKCNEGCVLEILNTKPIYMADKLQNVNNLKISAIRLIFTVENSAECGKIIEEYKLALTGKVINAPKENTITRGHFFRGVE